MIAREDEDLLLIDLSARLKYGVKVCIKLPNHEEKVFEEYVGDLLEITKSGGYLVNSKGIDYRSLSLDIKPYLRPMSSMTEEERIELSCLFGGIPDEDYIYKPYTDIPYSTFGEVIDWLNAHHFDYRGLIERGLALEAPKDIYNIQEKHKI